VSWLVEENDFLAARLAAWRSGIVSGLGNGLAVWWTALG